MRKTYPDLPFRNSSVFRLILPLSFIFIATLLAPGKSSRERNLTLPCPGENEKDETDAPLRLLHYEFKRMVDPSLGTVPMDRLKQAEDLMLQTANRGNRPNSFSWVERGPNNIGGRTRALLVDQSDGTGNTVFAGGVGGGLWKTVNFKSVNPTWTVINDFFANLAITCIKQNPNNAAEMYFGTGEGWGNIDAISGAGVWKSSNGGSSWTQLSSTTGLSDVEDLEFDNNGYIYASTRSSTAALRGVLRSTDGGANWTQVLTDPGAGITTRGADLERAPDGDMYATLGIFSVGHIFRSASNGTSTGISGSWTEITPSGITTNSYERVEIAVCPNNDNRIYAIAQAPSGAVGALYRTDNDGSAWSTLSNASWCDQGMATNADFSRGQAWYDLIMGVDPSNSNTVFAGGVVMVKTTNAGTSWAQATRWTSTATCTTAPVIHADIHEILFLNSSEMIVGTDGGIYYSSDGGASFTSKNGGYNVTQYYGMAISPVSGSNTMLAGAQDNGSHLFGSAGMNSVTSPSGGDGGFCFIDTTNSSVWITSFPEGSFNVFRSSGATFVGTFGTGSNSVPFIDPAEYASVINYLYCGDIDGRYGRLSNVESGSPNYSTVDVSAEMGANRQVSCVKVDQADETTIWLGCSDSQNNTGAPVTPILLKVIRANNSTGGNPANRPSATAFAGPALAAGAIISSIDIEPGNSNHMLLTVSNFGVTSVWESTDGGTTWSSIEGNLPDMPVRWGFFIPAGYHARTQSVGGVILATELGVWTTTTLNGGSTTWVANNSGLANVRVDQLVLRHSDKVVGAATHGRGVFTSTLLTTPLAVTLVDFTARLQGKDIVLEWSTASENNSSHFELERSYDGIHFEKIARLNAAGNSNAVLQYRYTDRNVLSEKNYYRLRSVDVSGESSLSNIVLVKIPGADQKVYVMGNPFHEKISLRFFREPQGAIDLALFDMSGKQLAQKQFVKTGQSLEWASPGGIPGRGIYLLRVLLDGKKYIIKLFHH